MPEAKTEQDPSIEEILESIRQIINEDGDAPADKGGADLRPKNDPLHPGGMLNALSEDEDKSDLTLKGEAEDASAGGVLDLTDKVESLNEAEINLGEDLMNPNYDPDPPPVIDLQEATAMTADDDSLLSDRTAEAATAEMAKLLAGNVAVERDEPARVGRVTLEDIARDLMRPLIKAWLDENLPRVIDRVVTRELEKLARRARDE